MYTDQYSVDSEIDITIAKICVAFTNNSKFVHVNCDKNYAELFAHIYFDIRVYKNCSKINYDHYYSLPKCKLIMYR